MQFRAHSRKDRRLYHFQLWFAPLRRHLPAPKHSIGEAGERDGIIANSSSHYGVFLYPDGDLLRAYWYMAAILVIGIVLAYRDNFPCLLTAFIAVYVVLFLLVNHVLLRRSPAFSRQLRRAVPPRLLPWLLNKISRIDLTRKDARKLQGSSVRGDHFLRTWLRSICPFSWLYILPICRPRLRLRKRYRYVGNRDVSEALLLRSGIASFFHTHKYADELGLWRFLFFWCAPIWIAYMAILVPLLTTFLFPSLLFHDNTKNVPMLIVPASLWIVVTFWFIFVLYRHLRECKYGVTYFELTGYPVSLQGILKDGVFLNELVAKPKLGLIVSVICSGLYLSYISLLALFVSSHPG